MAELEMVIQIPGTQGDLQGEKYDNIKESDGWFKLDSVDYGAFRDLSNVNDAPKAMDIPVDIEGSGGAVVDLFQKYISRKPIDKPVVIKVGVTKDGKLEEWETVTVDGALITSLSMDLRDSGKFDIRFNLMLKTCTIDSKVVNKATKQLESVSKITYRNPSFK